MYAKVNNTELISYPYTWEDIKNDNPFSNYDNRFNLIEWYSKTTEAEENDFSIVEVVILDIPIFDIQTQNIERFTNPILVNGVWSLDCHIIEKTEEEVVAYEEFVITSI